MTRHSFMWFKRKDGQNVLINLDHVVYMEDLVPAGSGTVLHLTHPQPMHVANTQDEIAAAIVWQDTHASIIGGWASASSVLP